MTERPNEWAFANHLERLEWLSENKMALINKDATDWSATIKMQSKNTLV